MTRAQITRKAREEEARCGFLSLWMQHLLAKGGRSLRREVEKRHRKWDIPT